MKKLNYYAKRKFAIKKLTIGVVSAFIGMSIIGGVAQASEIEKVVEQNETKVKIKYEYKLDTELTEEQKGQLVKGTPENIAKADKVYYMVYKAKKETLPNTGSDNSNVYLAGALGLLVLAVGISKNKKKVLTSIILLTTAGTSVTLPAEAVLKENVLSAYAKEIMVEKGQILENPILDIEGYEYLGFADVSEREENKENSKEEITTEISDTAPTVELPKEEITTEIPDTAPTVELPKEEITTEIPDTAPTVELPKGEITEIPDTPPTVELPKEEITTEIPDTAPTVELPKEEITTEIPDTAPTVENPKGEITEIPDTPPTVELPEEKIVEDKAETVEEIPYKIEKRETSNLKKGEEKVLVEGKNGKKVTTYKVIKDSKGNELARTVESETKIEPTTKVIEVGTYEESIPDTAPTVEENPKGEIPKEEKVPEDYPTVEFEDEIREAVTSVETPIPFETKVVENNKLPKGQTVVKVEGEYGVVRKLYKKIYRNEVFEKQILEKEERIEPVTKVVEVGTYEESIPDTPPTVEENPKGEIKEETKKVDTSVLEKAKESLQQEISTTNVDDKTPRTVAKYNEEKTKAESLITEANTLIEQPTLTEEQVAQMATKLEEQKEKLVAVKNKLELKANKETLKEKLAKLKELLGENQHLQIKTPETVEVYNKAKKSADYLVATTEEVVKDDNKVQKDVDAQVGKVEKVIEMLQEAIDQLVDKANTQQLEETLKQITEELNKKVELGDKTPSSVENYKNAKKEAESVKTEVEATLKDENASQELVNNKNKKLTDTLTKLRDAEKKLESRTDITELTTKIEGLREKIKEYDASLEDKTPESVQQYETAKKGAEDAIRLAESILTLNNLGEGLVASKTKSIEDALKKLEEAKNNLQKKEEKIDKEQLQQKEKELESKLAEYTEEKSQNKTIDTADKYSQALGKAKEILKEAKEVLASENKTQAEIDKKKAEAEEAITNLVTAYNNLKEAPEAEKEERQELENKLELRTTEPIKLYKLSGTEFEEVHNLDSVPTGDLSNYYLKVKANNTKDVWVQVEEIKAEGANFKVIGKDKNYVHYNEDTDGYVENFETIISRPESVITPRSASEAKVYTDFNALVAAIRANPKGNFVVGRDMYADEYKNDSRYYTYDDNNTYVRFEGTLSGLHNGKVHTIYNMNRPLFYILNNATVENINFINSNIDLDKSYDEPAGTLAGRSEGTSKISNVYVEGSLLSYGEAGGLVGMLLEQSEITNSAYKGTVAGGYTAGGLVGVAQSKTAKVKIKKSYFEGSVVEFGVLGNTAGGLVGTTEKTEIEDVYVKGNVYNSGIKGKPTAGLVGYLDKDSSLKNAVVIVNLESNGGAVISNYDAPADAPAGKLENIFVESSANKDTLPTNVTTLTKEQIEEKIAKTNYISKDRVTKKEDLSYSSVTNYDVSKKIAYKNIEKLIPLFKRTDIVKYGNSLSNSDKLVTTEIIGLSVMKDNKFVTNLYNEKNNINKLLVHFKDGMKEIYNITYDKQIENSNIYVYNIAEKNLKYHIAQQVVDKSDLVKQIADKLSPLTDSELFGDRNDLSMDKSLAEVKKDLENHIHGILDNATVGDYTKAEFKNYILNYVETNKKNIMKALVYLNRWYDINYDNYNIRDLVMHNPNFYGGTIDVLEMYREIGDKEPNNLMGAKNSYIFDAVLNKYLGNGGVIDFLRLNRKLFTPNKSDNDWLVSNTKAYIKVKDIKGIDKKTDIFEELEKRFEDRNMFLPILTMRDEGLFITANQVTMVFDSFDNYITTSRNNVEEYKKELAKWKGKADTFSEENNTFFETLHRILNEDSKKRLEKHHLTVYGGYNVRNKWSSKSETETNRQFFDAAGRWYTRQNIGAGAYVPYQKIEFHIQNLLANDSGMADLTHEYTHLLDRKVLFDNHEYRIDMGPESYARGLYENTVNKDNIGWNFAFKDPDRHHGTNTDPTQFETMADFEKYMKGMFDVLYTLDNLQAEAIIALNANEKYYFLAKLSDQDRRGKKSALHHKDDVVTRLTTTDWNVNLNKVDDFVDGNYVGYAMAGGPGSRKIVDDNDYMFLRKSVPQWGINENTKGSPGGYTLRRVGMELLAEKGYYDGLIPYISDQYYKQSKEDESSNELSDTYILKKIFDNKYSSYKEFKKDMLKRRRDDASKLKDVKVEGGRRSILSILGNSNNKVETETTMYDKLKKLMVDAVNTDIALLKSGKEINADNVYTLRNNIFDAYLKATNSFKESIYKDDKPGN